MNLLYIAPVTGTGESELIACHIGSCNGEAITTYSAPAPSRVHLQTTKRGEVSVSAEVCYQS